MNPKPFRLNYYFEIPISLLLEYKNNNNKRTNKDYNNIMARKMHSERATAYLAVFALFDLFLDSLI